MTAPFSQPQPFPNRNLDGYRTVCTDTEHQDFPLAQAEASDGSLEIVEKEVNPSGELESSDKAFLGKTWEGFPKESSKVK